MARILTPSREFAWRTPLLLLLLPLVTYFAVGRGGLGLQSSLSICTSSVGGLGVLHATGAAQAGEAAGAAPAAAPSPAGGWRRSPFANDTGHVPALPERQLSKGIVSHGETSRLRRVLAKLMRGEAATVVAVGGSITWGQGSSKRGELDWASRLFTWLRGTFPHSNLTLLNAAVPGTPSSYMSLCVRWHVPQDADLVILEYNINDGGGRADQIRRAHERLLRKLLAYPRRPAVAEMLFFRRPDTFDMDCPYRYFGDDEMDVLAQYYHLPIFSCRALMWDLTMVPNPRPEHVWAAWQSDANHPNDVGHGHMADMAVSLLTRVLDDLDRHPLEDADDAEAAAELPPPMYRGNYPAMNNTCLMGPHFQPLAVTTNGFQWVNEGSPEKPKEGWVATAAGSVLEFEVSTDIVAPPPEDGQLSASVAAAIVYLSSYEHMGKARVECAAGCTCEPRTFNGNVTRKATQQNIMLLEPTRAAACRMRVIVLDETDSIPPEHKVKVNGIIVSEASGWLISKEIEQHPHPLSITFGNDGAFVDR